MMMMKIFSLISFAGMETLVAIRKQQQGQSSASAGGGDGESPTSGEDQFMGTAGLGVIGRPSGNVTSGGENDDERDEGGEDIFRRSRVDAAEHCK
jgi:hypothetical protein